MGLSGSDCSFPSEKDEKVLTAIHRRLEKLRYACAMYDGFNEIIEGVAQNNDDDDFKIKLSDYDKFHIRMKCFYLI